MNRVGVNSDGAVRVETGEAVYVDSAANFVFDGGPALATPPGIAFMRYTQGDGRVIGHTLVGDQVEISYSMVVLDLAITTVPTALLAQAARVPQPLLPPPPVSSPPATDPSSVDNLDRVLRAMMRVMVTYTNQLKAGTYTTKTAVEVKADFLAAYNAIT
jgi:hypothetical protein